MKNEIPPVTSAYFVTLIRSYLQGHQTKRDILAAVSGLLPAPVPGEYADVTTLLLTAARQLNEHCFFDVMEQVSSLTDALPTRSGLICQLEALLHKQITPEDLLEWATWHYTNADEPTAGLFEDLTVEFCCLQLLPAFHQHLTGKNLQQALDILQRNCGDPLKEKVALVLLFEREKQAFLFFLHNYLAHQQPLEILDTYLLRKFGMDHTSFPYMAYLTPGPHIKERLMELLEKAASLK